ncbi:MAG: Holliday junction branch migration protein RuvA [Gammaproteobacteria bacterium]|nr:Holliday junction branch migration protein RuvA [Gammaproteobacteria bacterium]
MIGQLSGKLLNKQPNELLLDVNGVGYELEVPMSTLFALPDVGQAVTLRTHLLVRDDAHILFGFASDTERKLFRAVLKVNGVGAKMAIAILSNMAPPEFADCVAAKDVTALTRIPGVGKKTAERLLVEIGDRLDGLGLAGGAVVAPTGGDNAAQQEATEALMALGYKEAEIRKMLKTVEAEDLDSAGLIKAALQNAMRR